MRSALFHLSGWCIAPMPSPGERVARSGRETAPSGACGEQPPKAALGERRNSGRNLKISTNEQTSTGVATKTAPRRRSSHFQNHYVTARIPHQSWHRLWRHHDSFPPGEAMGAAAPEEQKMPFQNIGKGRAEARPRLFRYSPPAGPVRRRTSPGSGPGPCPRHPAPGTGGWRRG